MNFLTKLKSNLKKNKSLLCVGLDAEFAKIPSFLFKKPNPQLSFNLAIIDATKDLVCSYKPNIAFYEAQGEKGLFALKKTIEYLEKLHIPVILDAKRGDISNTASQYAKTAYEYLKADAVTINAYMGYDAVKPFLEYQDKYAFVLAKTSNPSSGDIQDLITAEGMPVYLALAKKALEWNSIHGNCGLVIGATFPKQLAQIRALSDELWILVPGVGKQGGNLEQTMQVGLNKEKQGLIVVSAREIIYASLEKNFDEKAREKTKELNELINKHR